MSVIFYSYCPTLYLIQKIAALGGVFSSSAVVPHAGVQSVLLALGSVLVSALLGMMLTL